MEFTTLFNRIYPKLHMIAKYYERGGYSADREDLLQEMYAYLWDEYSNGMPDSINEQYVVNGCRFHLMNFLKKENNKPAMMSMDEPVDENENTLKDILPDKGKLPGDCFDSNTLVEYVRKNGFSDKEKQAFFLLLDGYTAREAAEKMRISHVMVVKYRQKITEVILSKNMM